MDVRRFVYWLCLTVFLPLAHFWQELFGEREQLHRARFAHTLELRSLLSLVLPTRGLLLGTHFFRSFVHVASQETRPELGNLLIVGPTRSGKGLLAVSQLLSWQHSVIVNDIKGELFEQTAGYRATLGPVFVIDPRGVGHGYDPLHGKQTEDAFLAAAKQTCAKRLHQVDPQVAERFLYADYRDANFENKFLVSSWETLTAWLEPLLTETVIRSLSRTDFTPEDIIQGQRPVSVYLRWPERDLLALAPLVRLIWGSLIDELLMTHDTSSGSGCRPVLLLIDEAGRTAIPSLSDHATTVAGRSITIAMSVQSLSQLETIYGRAHSQTLKDNMETQLYYPPRDLATALTIEHNLGQVSAYAHSTTIREGEALSEGQTERPIPLLTAQEIRQLHEEEVLCFHRRLPPVRLRRMDWRQHVALTQRRRVPAPRLSSLPTAPDIPFATPGSQTSSDVAFAMPKEQESAAFPNGYIDRDRERNRETHQSADGNAQRIF